MIQGKSAGIMPNPLDTREIIFTNLLLLGFDPAAMEAKEHIPFNRDMFVLPNKKAMEVVMHFLFAKLNPQLTYEEFRDCWPVKNKSQEQQFRKTCFNWLTRLNKEEPDANLPRVVQSLFHSPGGDRFYSFLLLFSLYVLKAVMKRDHGKGVTIPPFPTKTIHNQSFSQVNSKATQAQTAVYRQRFLNTTQECLEVQKTWKAYANELTREHRSLKKKIREGERQLNGMANTGSIAKSLVRNEYQLEVEAIKRTQELQKVRSLWGKLEEFYAAHTPQREVIDTVLSGEANKYKLDATETQVKVPDLLLRECEEEIHLRKIENTYVGGKLNLLSLIQLWNLSLNSLREKLREESVPSFEANSAKIRNEVHSHQAYLSNAEQLRSTLANETIPALKSSIEELKCCLHQAEPTPTAAANYSFNLGLGLAPATPPVSFRAADTPVSDRVTSFHESLRRSPATVSTPEVVSAWSESLRGRRRPAEETQKQPEPQNHVIENKLRKSHLPKPVPKEAPVSRKPGVPVARKKQKQQTAQRQPPRGATASAGRPRTPAEQPQVKATPMGRGSGSRIKSWSRTEPRKKVLMKTPNQRLGDKTWAAQSVADQIIGVMSVDRPDSASGSSSRNSSRASTPQAHALEDPIAALDDTAFISHDLIPRTPAPKEKYAPSPDNLSDHLEPGYEKDDETLQASSGPAQMPVSAPPNRPGRLLETILDQANNDQELTPSKVKTALFRDSPGQNTGSPLTRTAQELPGSPMTRMMHEETGSPLSRLLQGTTAKWNDSPLSQFSMPSPATVEDQTNYEDERLLSPFSFKTPGKYQDTSPSDSNVSDQRSGSPVSPLVLQTPEGPIVAPSGTPFTPFKTAPFTPEGAIHGASGAPVTASPNVRDRFPVDTQVYQSPLVSFTRGNQNGPRNESSGTPHGTPFAPSKDDKAIRVTTDSQVPHSPLVSFTPYNKNGPRKDPNGTPRRNAVPLSPFTPQTIRNSDREEQSENVHSKDIDSLTGPLRDLHMSRNTPLSNYPSSSTVTFTDTTSSAVTTQSGILRDTANASWHRQSPLISLSEPTVSNNSQLFADEASDAALQASKRSPFGSLKIEDIETVVQEHGEEVPTQAEFSGLNKDSISPGQLDSSGNSPSVFSRLRTSLQTKDSPLRTEHTSDLMKRLNRIKQAQLHDVTYATPRQSGVGAREEDRGPGEGSALGESNMESWQAKRLKQIKEAQMSQQVTPGADTQANLDTSRDTEPAILTPLTASSRGTPENDLGHGKFTFEPPGTPPGEHLSLFSGKSSPSSILSERFLLQSPFKYDNGETSDAPLHRVFSLGSPALRTPENVPRTGLNYTSPWRTPGYKSLSGTPVYRGTNERGKEAPSPGTPDLSRYLQDEAPTPVLPSMRRHLNHEATSNRSLLNGSLLQGFGDSPGQVAQPTTTRAAVGTLIDFD